MGDPRLFVAFPLGGEALAQMGELLEKAPKTPEIKWSRADQLHLTLLFMGPTPRGKSPDPGPSPEGVDGTTQSFRSDLGRVGRLSEPCETQGPFCADWGNDGTFGCTSRGCS